MVDFSEVFIYSDQPTTCPKCGVRSELVLDLSHTKDETQIHKCPKHNCEYEFVMQFDEDFENGSLL
jgi:hypothetical protein